MLLQRRLRPMMKEVDGRSWEAGGNCSDSTPYQKMSNLIPPFEKAYPQFVGTFNDYHISIDMCNSDLT